MKSATQYYLMAFIAVIPILLIELGSENNNVREEAKTEIKEKLKEKWEKLNDESNKKSNQTYAFPFEVKCKENSLIIDYQANINLKNLNDEQKSSFMLGKYNFEEVPIGKMVCISLEYIIDNLLKKNMSKTIITGTCDNTPLKDKITYKGEFGENLSIPYYNITTNKESTMTFHIDKKLSDNYEFALLRAYSVFYYFKENGIPITIENTEFEIKQINEEGKRYCDFSITFENYFKD